MDNSTTPTSKKPAPKSQLIVLSPDVLKKLGIASQISKLTKNTSTALLTDSKPSINKTTLENEIKETLNNAKKNKQIVVDNDLQLKINEQIASNSTEINLNKHSNENIKINQINLNESNSLAKLSADNNQINKNVKDIIKNKIVSKINNQSSSVLNTSIRKSGRKRKVSSILENYVTELSPAKDLTEKHVKSLEIKQKLTKKEQNNKLISDCKINEIDELNTDTASTSKTVLINEETKNEDEKTLKNDTRQLETDNQDEIENINTESISKTALINEIPDEETKNKDENDTKQIAETSITIENSEVISRNETKESICYANQTNTTTNESIVIEDQSTKPIVSLINENMGNTEKTTEICDIINPEEDVNMLILGPSADSSTVSFEEEMESLSTFDDSSKTQEINKTNTSYTDGIHLDLESMDPQIAELLKPLKRGRPKGRKNRPYIPFIVEEHVKNESTDESIEEVDVPKRRSARTRKEKKLEDVIYYDKEIKDETPSKNTGEEITPRRRGRPPKKLNNCQKAKPIHDDSSSDDDNIALSKIQTKKSKSDEDFETDEEKTKKKRGRASNSKSSYNNKVIECAVCNEKMPNAMWILHCAKHNFLCWRVGEEPIDLTNRKLCENILLRVAMTRKVVFTCSRCGEKRKSAVGYFAHLDVCEKTEEERLAMRVACPECGRLMQPCSLKIHMRNHVNESLKSNTNTSDIGNSDVECDVTSEGGRTKRNAAKKAQGLINKFTREDADYQPYENETKRLYRKGSEKHKAFSPRKFVAIAQWLFKKSGSMECSVSGCPYIAHTFKKLKNHIETCPKLPQDDYLCFVCLHITQKEADIEKHVLEKHLLMQADDEFNEDESNTTFDDLLDDEAIDQSDENDDDESVCEEGDHNNRRKRKRKPIFRSIQCDYGRSCVDKVKFLAAEVRVSASRNCTYPPAGKWCTQFRDHNYSINNLFCDFVVLEKNWPLVNNCDEYLPVERESISVKTVLATKVLPELHGEHHQWKQFKLFESEIENDTITIFCGGPVWELAWLPTPMNSIVDQILAVSVQRDFNETYKTSQSYESPQMIQFWNFGKLHFETLITNESPVKLEFCLAHNHGNVWCMEWCPSGCYDDVSKSGRMGLLALACSDGNIPIYSIPFPEFLPHNNDDVNKILKPIESCKLMMQDDDELKLGNWSFQCTKLNWAKVKGHNQIAAGYSNGMVCLWDLSNKSPLLKNVDENGTILLKPYFSFQPHTAAVTALHFYPMGDEVGGAKWLFTGSWDRYSYVWDIQDASSGSSPAFVFAKRGNVSDGALINHWLCSFIAFDDVHFVEHTTTSIQNPRDFGFKNSSLLSANSMVMGLSASDWANAIAQVTLAGELCCTFQRQLLVGYDVDKGSRSKRFLLSYCEAIDKHMEPKLRKEKMERKCKEAAAAAANINIPEKYDKNFFRYLVSKENESYDDEPETYEQTLHKYGIIFADISLDKYEKIPVETLKIVKTSSNMKDAPTEMYPILSQNRVRWNPNKQAYIYICSGYHSGFVRLRCVRFMRSKLFTTIT